MSYAMAVVPSGITMRSENEILTNRGTPEIAIVDRSSTDTPKSPPGTAMWYVPVGSLRARKIPPSSRVKTSVRGSENDAPLTVTRPDACVARVNGIGRSTAPEIVTSLAKRNVSVPWVRFAYTVYVPVATYVWNRPAEVSATRFSAPSNVTGAFTGFPESVTFPVTRARWTRSTSWATDGLPTSRATTSGVAVCHRTASEPALTFASTMTWYRPGLRGFEYAPCAVAVVLSVTAPPPIPRNRTRMDVPVSVEP